MTDSIGKSIGVVVKRKSVLGNDAREDGRNKELEGPFVEILSFQDKQAQRDREDQRDAVFADDLEPRQPVLVFEETDGEDSPVEDQGEKKRRNHAIAGHKETRDDLPVHKEGSDEEREAHRIAIGDPQLCRQVGVGTRENGHSGVAECVDQIERGDKKRCNSQKEKSVVVEEAPRIPGHEKDAAGHRDAEHLGQAVEEQKTVPFRQIQSHQDRRGNQDVEGGLGGRNVCSLQFFAHHFCPTPYQNRSSISQNRAEFKQDCIVAQAVSLRKWRRLVATSV